MDELKNWPPKRKRPIFDPYECSGQILAPKTNEVKFCPPNEQEIKFCPVKETPLRLDAYMDDLHVPLINTDWEADDLLAILESIPDEPQTRPKSPKSPRRKTYGAMLNDLRIEVLNLKTEIELRDAYIFSILHELTRK